MARSSKPPFGGTSDQDNYDPWSHAEVFHRTVHYGADEAKRYYDRLYVAEGRRHEQDA